MECIPKLKIYSVKIVAALRIRATIGNPKDENDETICSFETEYQQETDMSRTYFKQSRSVLAALVAIVVSSVPLSGLHASDDAVLLTVENTTRAEELDRAALDALPQVSFETTTIWTEGTLRFSGPALRDVLAEADLLGRAVIAEAANDYRTTLSADLIGDKFPIVATRINGEPFGVRQKGPLWIIFPYDLSDEFQREAVFAGSVWQLKRLRPAEE